MPRNDRFVDAISMLPEGACTIPATWGQPMVHPPTPVTPDCHAGTTPTLPCRNAMKILILSPHKIQSIPLTYRVNREGRHHPFPPYPGDGTGVDCLIWCGAPSRESDRD